MGVVSELEAWVVLTIAQQNLLVANHGRHPEKDAELEKRNRQPVLHHTEV